MKYFIVQYWKIIAGIVSVFIGGLGFGAVLESLRHRDNPPPPPAPVVDKDWVESTLASLHDSLGLSDEQREAIRPHVQAAAREIQLSRQSAIIKFEISLLELHRSIAPNLGEEQKEKLQKSQAILEKRIQQRSAALLEGDSGRIVQKLGSRRSLILSV